MRSLSWQIKQTTEDSGLLYSLIGCRRPQYCLVTGHSDYCAVFHDYL